MLEELLRRGVAEGRLAPDVTLEDALLELFGAFILITCNFHDFDESVADRIVDLVWSATAPIPTNTANQRLAALLVDSAPMVLTRYIVRSAAVLGIVAIGAMGPLGDAADASSAAPDISAEASVDVASEPIWHGPWRDLATCNYWMWGVRSGGHRTTDCFEYEFPTFTGWSFIEY
jgi:hypothetical protein